MSGSNPPSTNGSPRLARRALTTGTAALMALALPVALVATSSGLPTSEGSPALASATNTSFLRGQLELVRARSASDPVQFRGVSSAATPAVIEPTAEVPTTTAPPAPPTTAAPAPAPAPAPTAAPSGSGNGDPNDPASWDRLARCESGGNWATNTGNGYYGGIQFSLSSWRSVGGTGYPNESSRETQIQMGQRLYNQGGGWHSWPGCTKSFGWPQ